MSAIFQCADAIAASLASFQEAQSAGEKLSLGRPGAISRTSIFGSEDPIAFAIEAAGTITLCAQHQKRIVDDVLVLSKVDAKLIEIHPIDCQPGSLIENSLKMFSAELQANNSIMSFRIEDSIQEMGIDWVKLDPGRLLQVRHLSPRFLGSLSCSLKPSVAGDDQPLHECHQIYHGQSSEGNIGHNGRFRNLSFAEQRWRTISSPAHDRPRIR